MDEFNITSKIPFQQAPQLTLLAAVAVAQAIEHTTDLKPKIKWPNDILINRKKVTGILTELQGESDRIHSVIIGIGMNINQQKSDFPEELQEMRYFLINRRWRKGFKSSRHSRSACST